MNDLRHALEQAERAAGPAGPGPDLRGFIRYRDRRRRNQRVLSAAVALLLALVAVGGAIRAFGGGARQRPASIDPSNVSRLQLAWSAQIVEHGKGLLSGMAVSNGVVYVGSSNGLEAFSASCSTGGRTCRPLWTGFGVGDSRPVVSGGVVYVATWGRVEAFPTSCGTGGGTCQPLWRSPELGNFRESTPAVADGMVYVVAHDGHLYAFPAICGSGGATCDPSWSANIGVPRDKNGAAFSCGACFTDPVAADGMVYVSSTSGYMPKSERHLYAFSARCGTSGAACEPAWLGESSGNATIPPVVSDGLVFSSPRLRAYSASCGAGGGPCRPLWVGPRGTWPQPLIAGGHVIVGTKQGVEEFELSCIASGGDCRPVWNGPTGEPFVAGDAVYLARSNTVTAYRTSCTAVGGRCRPIWTARVQSDRGLVVENGVVYAMSVEGLSAFPASCATPCRPSWTYTRTWGAQVPIVAGGTVFVQGDTTVFAFGLPS